MSCKCNICDTCLGNIILNFNQKTSFINLNCDENVYFNKSTTYDIGPIQQPNNFYSLPNSDYNFIFECTALNVTSRMLTTPLTVDYYDTAQIGFGNVSEIAVLEVTADKLDGLFIYQSQPNIIAPDYFDQLYYGVSAEVFNFSYSHARVKKTDNLYIPLFQDYVESISQILLNANISIFKNESKIMESVISLNDNFNYTFNMSVKNARGLYSGDETPFSNCCRNLITGVLTLSPESRKDMFYDSATTQNNSVLSFKFVKGDVIAVKIIYRPRNSIILGNIYIPSRSYKIFITVI
jgi:hypothetical protein